MIFQNKEFAYFLFFLLIPIIIFILQRFFLPTQFIPSLIYILEQREIKKNYLQNEVLKLILQLLIIFFLIAGFGNLLCSNRKKNITKKKIAIIDNSFPLSKNSQGERPAYHFIKTKINELAIQDVFYLSDLLNLEIKKSVLTTNEYYNSTLNIIDNFNDIEKILLKNYGSLLNIHYFSAFCFSDYQKVKLKSTHDWNYYPLTNRKENNLYFKNVKFLLDPMSAHRLIINGEIAASTKLNQLVNLSVVINGVKQGLQKLDKAKKKFRFPFESKAKFVEGFLELKGDDLTYDNKYFFTFKSPGKINIYIKDLDIYPLLENIFEPASVSGATRYSVKKLDKEQTGTFTKNNSVAIFYGSKSNLKSKIKILWFYNSNNNFNNGLSPLELEQGKKIANTKLAFKKLLSAYKAKAKVLVEFEDATPAVIQDSDTSIQVLFDPLSASDDGLYSIEFLFFLQDILNKLFFKELESKINSTELAKANFAILPKIPGNYNLNDTKSTNKNSLKLAYNASPELSSCTYLSISELKKIFPGKFSSEQDDIGFWEFNFSATEIYFVIVFLLLVFYVFIFELRKEK